MSKRIAIALATCLIAAQLSQVFISLLSLGIALPVLLLGITLNLGYGGFLWLQWRQHLSQTRFYGYRDRLAQIELHYPIAAALTGIALSVLT